VNDLREREFHLLDYWRIVVNRRWVLYTSLIVVVVTVTLGSLLKRPVYTATTRLQIEQNMPKVLPFQEVMASVPDRRNDFYQTQYGLIRSRKVAGDVIGSLGLAKVDEFEVRVGKTAGRGLTPEKVAEFKRIDRFLKKLNVSPVRNSRLVDVSFASYDPVLSARIANRVADTYIAFNSQVQYNTTARATTSLAHQVANLQEQIDAKEKELQAYAREHGIIALSDEQNIALKNLNDLSDSHTRARAERIEREARYAALRRSIPEALPEVLQSQLIRELTAKAAELARKHAQLSEKYQPDWPEMVRLRREIDDSHNRLETERRAIYQQVLGAAEAAYRTARNNEHQLEKALDDQKRQSQEFGLKEIQYNNLKAEIANRRTTIEALLKRQAETSSSAGLDDPASNVRVVDRAEIPTHKSSPKILQNILLSALIGLALGIGLAFFFEYLDKSVKSPEEIPQVARIPSIGLIPAQRTEGAGLRAIRGNGRDQVKKPTIELITLEDPQSSQSEAFRDIRTALMVSRPGGPPKTILVASAQPGEGKTSIAVNLAITLAQIGRLVLLVDTDLRKPRIHKLFGLPNDQGLSTCLSASGAPWAEPSSSKVSGLDVVTSGPLPPNAADLLDSERFSQIQSELDQQGYDHIIYDSPPVLAVADAAIMAAHMDAVVMVVQAGVTSREALAHGVERLRQVKASILGAVLNRVDFDQQGYYGYAYKRYYGDRKLAVSAPGQPTARQPERTAQI
jgi:capsular exopolysaccharide synthesis family protein